MALGLCIESQSTTLGSDAPRDIEKACMCVWSGLRANPGQVFHVTGSSWEENRGLSTDEGSAMYLILSQIPGDSAPVDRRRHRVSNQKRHLQICHLPRTCVCWAFYVISFSPGNHPARQVYRPDFITEETEAGRGQCVREPTAGAGVQVQL